MGYAARANPVALAAAKRTVPDELRQLLDAQELRLLVRLKVHTEADLVRFLDEVDPAMRDAIRELVLPMLPFTPSENV